MATTERAQMTEGVGAYLRALREAAGLSLRAVQDRCRLGECYGVSNGYLSQLERDRVTTPSPHALRALAACYGADYRELLRRAGYLLPTDEADGDRPPVVFAGAEQLTAEERAEIQEIIALKLRRRRQPASIR